MKRKTMVLIVFSVIGILIVILAWLGSRDRLNAHREQVDQLQQVIAASEDDQERKILERRLQRLIEEKGGRIQLDDVLALLPEPERLYYRMGFNLDDIEFHGEVVDQHGNAVAGARFEIGVMGSFLAGGTGIRMRANDAGYMRINTKGGRFFEIAKIEHPDCYWVSPMRYSSGQRTRLRFYGYKPNEHEVGFAWSDYTAVNPYIFRMWCLGEGDGEVLWGEVAVPGGRASEPVFRSVDFVLRNQWRRDKRIEWMFAERDKGHLIFQMFDEEYPGNHLKELSDEEYFRQRAIANDADRDWWIEITAVDGGFIPVPDDDVYMNEAPESGYQPMIRFEGRGNVRTARGGPIRYYYFMTNGGAEYGVVSVRIFSPVSDIRSGQSVRLGYKFNPSGPRNLATRDFRP